MYTFKWPIYPTIMQTDQENIMVMKEVRWKIYRQNYSISMELWNRQIKFIVTEIRLRTKYTGEAINEKT